MRPALPLLVASCLFATQAGAAIKPHPGPGDPHIQAVDYDPDQVVDLRVAQGYSLTVAFSPDEQIQTVSIGNSAGWQVTADKGANRLFIKPTLDMIETDMTVVTDTRTYVFDLDVLPEPSPTMPFVVRFEYPAAPQVSVPSAATPDVVVYRFSGARELRPLSMSDDGKVTTITWPDQSIVPVAVLIQADGRRSLANGVMRDGRYIVQGVAARFEFRADGKSAYATRQAKKAAHE